jgi:uncharacterized protein
MMGFVFRLISPRPTFALDMTPDELAVMTEHVGYWSVLLEQGKVLAFGPVDDPAGPYGIGIVTVEDQEAAEALRDGDPVFRSDYGFRTEIVPMAVLVSPSGVYEATSAPEG